MTRKFDEYYNKVLNEAAKRKTKRCNGPTLPELSDNPRYIFSRCAPNPYTSGYKKIYYLRRDEPLTLDKCKNDPRYGTSKYEECRLAKIAHRNRQRRLRRRRASRR